DFNMYLNLFFMFTGYISMCYSYISYSCFHGVLYSVFIGNTIVYSLSILPFLRFPRYFIFFLLIQLCEPILISFNFRFFFEGALYARNKKTELNILFRNAINVS
ncbi:hypothetical protein H311_04900, partial [Anncaliia algerae PRA109]